MKNTAKSKIRAWYCRRSFWLGAFGLLIILWSWRDSFRYVRAAHFPDSLERGTSIVSYISLHSRVGILGLTHESIDYAQRKNSTIPNRGFSAQSSQINQRGWENLRADNPSAFQLPFKFYNKTDKEIQTSYFYVAHWALLIIYSAVWAGLYSYRSSRLANPKPTKEEAEQGGDGDAEEAV